MGITVLGSSEWNMWVGGKRIMEEYLTQEYIGREHYTKKTYGNTGFKEVLQQVIDEGGQLVVDKHTEEGMLIHIKKRGLERDFLDVGYKVEDCKQGKKMSVDVGEQDKLTELLSKMK